MTSLPFHVTPKDTMHKRTKLVITTLLALLACSLIASSASANRSIELRGAGGGVQAAGRITLFGEGESRGAEITCDVTLLRTVTGLIPKMRGTLFGKLTGIALDRGETTRSPHCRHGSIIREVHDMVPLLGPERPCPHRELGGGVLLYDCSTAAMGLWKLIYLSFQGTLPRIAGIDISIAATQFLLRLLEPFGGTTECLYEGTVFGLIEIREPEATVTGGRIVEALTRLPLRRSRGIGCPETVTLLGEVNVRPTLTIRLL
jgi:hypothetical protein